MSDTVFVTMYNPNLGNVQVDAPLQAVSTYQAHGWLLLDPNATPPPIASPYLSQPAADSRYLRDWAGAEVLTAGAVRVAPDGHVIVRVADGTTRSTYDTTEQALWTALGGANDPALRAAFAAVLTPTATKTATYAAAVGELAMMNVAGGGATLTLPTAPANKAQVGFRAIGATATVPLVINRGGSTDTIGTTGLTSTSIPLDSETGMFQYDAANTRWLLVDGFKPLATLDLRYPRQAGPLGGAKAKIATNPTAFKMSIVGDSTSDPATAAHFIYRRLLGMHTQQGEALYEVASTDYFTDGVSTGTTTFTSATAAFTAADVGRYLHGKNVPLSTIITAVGSSTSVTLSAAVPSGTSLPFWVGRHIIGGGNNGELLSHWMANPSLTSLPYYRDKLVADAPDLTVASWLINDVRQGGLGLTEAAIVTAGTALLQTFVDWHRTTLPNTDLLLRMPNSLLSADTSGLHFVTDGTTTNPAGLAQVYSTALRRIYLSFVGKYPNVDVIDMQGEVFGTRSLISTPLMVNQLHPSVATLADINQMNPTGGGYTAIADALAKRIGFARNAFPAEVAQRVRTEFVVYDGPSAGTVRLQNRDANVPGSQAPVFRADNLYINGMDGPIALTSANIDRTFSSTTMTISSLGSTDFSPYIGQTAAVASSHPGPTTGDRQQIFVDLPSIAATTTATVSVTVTGASPGNNGWGTTVIASPGGTFAGTAGLLLLGCYPSSTDTVKLVIQNTTAGAIDLAGESWTFWVVR